MARVTDPVCGMSVDPKTAAESSTHEGVTYYFCSSGCQQQFDANPATFTPAAGGDTPAQPSRGWLARLRGR